MLRTTRRFGYPIALVLVATGTATLVPFRDSADFAHLAWFYLCLVSICAWMSGTGPALLSGVIAFLAGNFFLTRPYGTFAVAEPLDVVQLGVFLLAAMTIGTLTGRLREREIAARRNEGEATALAKLAAEMAQGSGVDDVVQRAVVSLTRLDEVESVTVWLPSSGAQLVAHGPGARFASPQDREFAARAFSQVKAHGLSHVRGAERLGSGWPALAEATDIAAGVVIPLVAASSVEGVLQLVTSSRGLSESEAPLVVSIANLLALFLAGRRAVSAAARVQAAEEADQVKSAIVSAVSHELKTPLASAMAAVSDLASDDVTPSREDMRARLASTELDLRRLETAIGDLLDLSRLQTDEWLPHPELYEVGEIFGDVAAATEPLTRRRFEFRLAEDDVPTVCADFAQVSRAIRAIVENAAAYSPKESPIILGAVGEGDFVRIWVEDRGPGVSDEDKPFVFDRAYRGESGRHSHGSTGLGLTIARDLVAANKGWLFVEDASPHGARFVIGLPSGGLPQRSTL